MKHKVGNFNLKRKDFTHGVFDFNFIDAGGVGFCGSLFIKQFPHTKDANIVRLRVSKTRDHRKGEQKLTLVEGFPAGVMCEGQFIMILNAAVRHVQSIVKIEGGDVFYVRAIVVS